MMIQGRGNPQGQEIYEWLPEAGGIEELGGG